MFSNLKQTNIPYRGIAFSKKSQTIGITTTWMSLQGILLRVKSQYRKHTDCMILSEKERKIPLQLGQRENKMNWSDGWVPCLAGPQGWAEYFLHFKLQCECSGKAFQVFERRSDMTKSVLQKDHSNCIRNGLEIGQETYILYPSLVSICSLFLAYGILQIPSSFTLQMINFLSII